MVIWGKHKPTGDVEYVARGEREDMHTMLTEYSLAYGKDWILWAGLKRDEPKENNNASD